MRIEALDFCEDLYCAAYVFDAFLIEVLEGDLLYKRVYRNSRVTLRVGGGR